jgi:hypothetical protein
MVVVTVDYYTIAGHKRQTRRVCVTPAKTVEQTIARAQNIVRQTEPVPVLFKFSSFPK